MARLTVPSSILEGERIEKKQNNGNGTLTFLSFIELQIARKRHKVIGVFKSPHGHTRPSPSLKHVVLMPLSQIKKVLDIRETEGLCVLRFCES